MRWIIVFFLVFCSWADKGQAQTPTASPSEVKRACKKFLSMSRAQQAAVAKRSKKYTRQQMIWACGVILSRRAGGAGSSGSGGSSGGGGPQPESSWQCRAEGEVGRQPVSGTGIGDSQAAAQSFALSNCNGDCHISSCTESQSGSTSQWTCWADGYSYSRKETYDGSYESDRSSAERSALSACSWQAKDCSVISCSSR